jgi:spore coat polysaccharide biosynthesis protein SpsF (cytidylyltransferase family)
MKFSIFIPVRLQSKRLPKKALKKIDGKPMIQLLVERLQKNKEIDDIIICTTDHPSDDELVKFLEKINVVCYRGSVNDILDRFLKTAEKFEPDFIIAVDGDDIYTDTNIIKKIITEFKKSNADCYQITGVPVGFTPIGFKTSTLVKICSLKNTTNTETGYGRFFFNKKLFNIHKIHFNLKNSFPEDLRMSLDYETDFKIAKKIFDEFGNNFHLDDIMKFLYDHPKILDELLKLQIQWNRHWNKNLSDISIRDM